MDRIEDNKISRVTVVRCVSGFPVGYEVVMIFNPSEMLLLGF